MTLLKKWNLSNRIDPFYSYLHITEACGEGEVYLLDGAAETQSAYKMSIIAALPVVEVQIKDGNVILIAEETLLENLVRVLQKRGYARDVADAAVGAKSVIAGERAVFFPKDAMDFLEALRTGIRSFFGDTDLAPFAQGFLGYVGYDAVHYLESLPKTTIDDRDLPDVRLQWHSAVIQLTEQRLELYSAAGILQQYVSAEQARVLLEKTKQISRLAADWIQEPPSVPAFYSFSSASGAKGDVNANQQTAGDQAMMSKVPETYNWPPTSAPVLDDESPLTEDVSQEDFENSVRKAKTYIEAGDIFQVVLSKRIRIKKRMHHYEAYDRLRKINPSPYMFMSEYPDMRLFGASPEVQFRTSSGRAEMKPIAGTSKGRGATPEEDKRLSQRLLNDEKERAEHIMLVDLCRNDLGRVSKIGSVSVEDFMTVEPYSHLFHLVSTIRSELREDVNVFHALLSTFPAGTLSGAPKIRAMEIIDELEPYRRGPYGGMIGMIDFDANANTAIVIRTIVETTVESSSTYFVQVGAGIVADSNPEQEWMECGHKSGAILAVLNEKPGVRV
ncbi:anthranilate synthase component I family protein [Alicyclobacillus sp. SO9]|uniref:anthranilate synthase component I family protein n=1 Tax=Alicyclobacillus sp. SO9 TaxID=2665646 RepID=UPI0018E8DD75|nr:anthranilate synthase component I family protein [Alicyclobacillus sp. SO9]QQE80607.1 anthranilate synthase component I family protein [Alicyclobacillus sp. SO9]